MKEEFAQFPIKDWEVNVCLFIPVPFPVPFLSCLVISYSLFLFSGCRIYPYFPVG